MKDGSNGRGRPAVFLDRDGVLNQAIVRDGRPYPPERPEDVEILPGVVDACTALRQAGLLLFVVTNQPDVARGTVSLDAIGAIHQHLLDRIPLDAVFVCPHDDADRCQCRKPLPGLLQEAAAEWNVDLAASVMVGDRWRDIEAGRQAGCATVFIDAGYRERRPDAPDLTAPDLIAALPWILDRLAAKEEAS